MEIGEKIRNYRKEAGLTQEQVANYLGVSAPAVNKWEKGNTYPDILLLPALARLLNTDINELFSFREELTELEIAQFANQLSKKASNESVASAFAMATEKIKEYPHCHDLIYNAATVLNCALALVEIDETKKAGYDAVILKWFVRALESPDETIKMKSISMLAAKYMQMQQFEKAGFYLDKIPDIGVDTAIMRTEILAHEEDTGAAAVFLEAKVLQAAVTMQSYLYKLIELEVETENKSQAEKIAEIADRMVTLFGLWEYGNVVPHLLVSVYAKDRKESVRLSKKVLEEARKPWDMEASPLYYRYAGNTKNKFMERIGDSFIRNFLFEIENKKEYEFLKEDRGIKEILEHNAFSSAT